MSHHGNFLAIVEERGPHQFRVKVRRNGVALPSRTLETRADAENYPRIMDGKVSGNEYVEANRASATSLTVALDWYDNEIVPRTPRSARNKRGHIAAWKASRFADWTLNSLKPWDLLDWRRDVLDEDNAEEESQVGPMAEFGVQTCVHRLNLLSHLYRQWSLLHKCSVDNPVIPGVRPVLDSGRNRRLAVDTDDDGQTEQDRLFQAVGKSKSKWLAAATRVALETCMRQAEVAGLTWDRVRLEGEHPYVDLPKTKNDRPRRVPLSTRAVAAFRSLLPEGEGAKSRGKVFSIETPRAIGHAFRAVVSDEAFPNLRWHDLRHEGISRLFENTDLRDHEIMAMTGHLSPEMLHCYTHLRTHRLASRLPPQPTTVDSPQAPLGLWHVRLRTHHQVW